MSENIIGIEHVNFKYKGSEFGLLNEISLNVSKGETLLLTGASGSGKTTIIRLINGLIPHYYQGDLAGKVTVAGRDVAKTELYELAGVVGTVFQNPRSQFFSIDTARRSWNARKVLWIRCISKSFSEEAFSNSREERSRASPVHPYLRYCLR